MSTYQKLDDPTSDPFADDTVSDFNIDNDDDDDIIIQPDMNSQPKSNKKKSSSTKLKDIDSTSTPTPVQSSSAFSQSHFRKTYEGGFFSLNYYRQFFDLSSSQFFSNCLTSMNPISQPSADEFNKVGDLYASIWITATLVFLLFFCNSFASLLSGWFLGIDLDTLEINYFKMIVSSINLLYGYTFIIPLILYLVLKYYLKVLFLVPLTKVISIYSYANLLWTPAVLLSIFRGLLVNHNTLDTVLKWCCIVIGAFLSGCSIVYKIRVYFTSIFGEDDKKSMYILLALLILAHIGFAIGVKVSFFGTL